MVESRLAPLAWLARDLPTGFPAAPADPRALWWESMEEECMESPPLAGWGTWRESERWTTLAVGTLWEQINKNERGFKSEENHKLFCKVLVTK